MPGSVFQNDARDVDFRETKLGPEVLYKELIKNPVRLMLAYLDSGWWINYWYGIK